MDLGEVSFRGDITVVEQAIMKSISMLVGEGLHSMVSVKFKFQASLVVVLKSQLKILDTGAESSGGQ